MKLKNTKKQKLVKNIKKNVRKTNKLSYVTGGAEPADAGEEINSQPNTLPSSPAKQATESSSESMEISEEEINKMKRDGLKSLNELIEKHFAFDHKVLQRILIRNKAILAGGTVLSAVNNIDFEDIPYYGTYISNDLDIYVNLENAQQLYSDIISYLRVNPYNHDEHFYNASVFAIR